MLEEILPNKHRKKALGRAGWEDRKLTRIHKKIQAKLANRFPGDNTLINADLIVRFENDLGVKRAKAEDILYCLYEIIGETLVVGDKEKNRAIKLPNFGTFKYDHKTGKIRFIASRDLKNQIEHKAPTKEDLLRRSIKHAISKNKFNGCDPKFIKNWIPRFKAWSESSVELEAFCLKNKLKPVAFKRRMKSFLRKQAKKAM